MLNKVFDVDVVINVDPDKSYEVIDKQKFNYKDLSYDEFSKIYKKVASLGFNFFNFDFFVEQILGFVFIENKLQFMVKLGGYINE